MATDSDVVQIRRSGNLLEIDPARQDILDAALSYQHRDIKFGRDELLSNSALTIDWRSLYRLHDGKLYTMQGALHRVTAAFDKYEVAYTYEDLRPKTALEPDYDHLQACMPRLQFRLKQNEIMAHLIGLDCGQIVAPTAYGKTFIMLALVALYPKAHIIIASPGTALLKSTYRRIKEITMNVGRVGGGRCHPDRVTLATYQSILRAPVDKCDILLLDEAHRLAAPKIAENIAKIKTPVKIFGMTATPIGRSDNAELVIETLIGPKIYEVDYQEAAEANIVANLRVALLSMQDCPLQGTTWRTRVAKKRNLYWRNNIRNTLFANRVQEIPKALGIADPQTLVMTETVEHAFRLKQLLPAFEVVYGSMSKERLQKLQQLGLVGADYKPLTGKERDTLLTRFETGDLRGAIATGCWGEGVDFVYLDVLANPSGMASPIDTVQWAGRNSRLNESKRFGLIIDSRDKWDKWTAQRAAARIREYRKRGWEIFDDPLAGSY